MGKAYIYKKTLEQTGKSYIGKHNGNDPYYKGSGKLWVEDLKKFKTDKGFEIKTTILEYVDDIDNINQREEYWLEKLNVENKDEYYNLTNKAHGCSSQSKETKEKKSKSLKGRKITWGDKISKSLKGKNLNIPRHTEKSKKKIKDKMKNHQSLINNKERGDKISISLKKNHKRGEKISKALIGKPKSEAHKQNLRKPKPQGFNNNLKKPITQTDLEGNIIQHFESLTEAAKITGFNLQAIGNCAVGKSKSSFGFLWYYDDDRKLYNEKPLWDGWDDIKMIN